MEYDVVIIGGGIVGTATAMTLSQRHHISILVLEAEDRIAAHQTGHNSGVIHSGLYYKPGSLKAETCAKGRKALYTFCEEHGIAHERCGKIVVATEAHELPLLDELDRRGEANGLVNIKRLDAAAIKEYEPHVAGIGGLHVPDTGIVDFTAVANAYATVAREHGVAIALNARVENCKRHGDRTVIQTKQNEYSCRFLINTAGLQCDRVARMCGAETNVQIIPFRGEYYTIRPERKFLVKNLVYPVPDPRFPFLGVHFTRTISGDIEAGPNAVLALKREGYTKSSISPHDICDMAFFPGFWRMGFKYWKTGLAETYRSYSKKSFAQALERLVPEIREDDIVSGGSGVRAQAVDVKGNLLDDFCIIELDNMLHVINAPSPAATASLSIGDHIATLAKSRFGFGS